MVQTTAFIFMSNFFSSFKIPAEKVAQFLSKIFPEIKATSIIRSLHEHLSSQHGIFHSIDSGGTGGGVKGGGPSTNKTRS